MNKFMKYSAKVGGIWGFVNGLFLILSFLGGVPNTTIQLNSIYTYIFLPYYIVSNILFTTFFQDTIFPILKIAGTNGAGGLLSNIIFVIVMIAFSTLIGAIIISGIAMLVDKLTTSVRKK
jgi:hypothetical protein